MSNSLSTINIFIFLATKKQHRMSFSSVYVHHTWPLLLVKKSNFFNFFIFLTHIRSSYAEQQNKMINWCEVITSILEWKVNFLLFYIQNSISCGEWRATLWTIKNCFFFFLQLCVDCREFMEWWWWRRRRRKVE